MSDREDYLTKNILDYCRTLYAIRCRDGINNTVFTLTLNCMFSELEELDGKESMEKLRQEAVIPQKEVHYG
jgi:hypothetical protein